MSRSRVGAGTLRAHFVVYDSADVVVPGLLDGDVNWTKRVTRLGANNAAVVTITHVADGRYEATFSAPDSAFWSLNIMHALHNLRGWEESWDVTTTWPPAVDISGQVTVGTIAAGAINAASIATNAIDADALAADAVTEIQAGMATLGSVQVVQARLPVALVGGRMDSSVGAMVADVVSAAAFAADAVSEIADGVLDRAIGGSASTRTLRQVARSLAAWMWGKSAGWVSGAATPAATFRNEGDTQTVLSAPVDKDGNRTATATLDLT